MKTTDQIIIGDRVVMTSENSNWEIGERGTVTRIHSDRVAIEFDGREDDYTALIGDFKLAK